MHRNNTVNAGLTGTRTRLSSGLELRLEVHTDIASVRNDIQTMRRGSFGTLFNAPAWLDSYIATHQHNETPCIIVARDGQGDVAFIWPMSIRRQYAASILGWLGQSVFAVNLGYYRNDVAANLTKQDLERVFATLRDAGLPFDAVHLLNQPDRWQGVHNPMLALGQQIAPNGNFERPLSTNFDQLYMEIFTSRERRNHARQRRRLLEYGEIDVAFATSEEDQADVLEAFFTLKSAQLDLIGASNPFKSETAKTFYRRALSTIENRETSPVFCSLKVDGTIVATLIGVADAKRFTTLMSAITLAPVSKASPGQQLLEFLVQTLCDKGIETFDFGPGPSPQKRRWEMQSLPLYHSFCTLNPMAHPATWLVSGRSRLMHEIKNNDRAFRLLTQARARMAGKA